jgi:nucleoside-triphosphatase
MAHGARKVLLTGPPGCGKSTLIQRIVGQIRGPKVGFYTAEIRQGRERVGFSITTLDGRTGILAHRQHTGPFRVGRYWVNLRDLEEIAVPSMMPRRGDEIVVIDEIGKMECLSSLFRETLLRVLHSSNGMLASIAEKGDEFMDLVKGQPGVLLYRVDPRNRDSMVGLASLFHEL